jgi:hypothetical protein
MTDRTIKSKSPWFKYFTLETGEKLDDLDRARIEKNIQFKELRLRKRSLGRSTVK